MKRLIELYDEFAKTNPTPRIQLEAGKFYVLRNGEVVGPARATDSTTYSFKLGPSRYTSDGFYYESGREHLRNVAFEYDAMAAFLIYLMLPMTRRKGNHLFKPARDWFLSSIVMFMLVSGLIALASMVFVLIPDITQALHHILYILNKAYPIP